MKTHFKINIIILTLLLLLPLMQLKSQGANSSDTTVKIDPADTVSLETFQKGIPADQGQWIKVNSDSVDADGVTDGSDIDDDICRDYVWRPYNVGPDWNPYTNGYWEYTNYGWMWVSYYSWGWGPYHYGRWWYSDYYGWVWSPGYIWAPCWVSWRYWGGYAGWYPLSPRCRWHHGYGYNINNCHFRENNWTFVEYRHFSNTNITKTITKHPEIPKTATTVNDIDRNGRKVINKGPEVSTVENASGQKVRTRNIDNIKKIPSSVSSNTEINSNSDSKRPNSEKPKSVNNGNSRKTKNNDNGYKPIRKKRNDDTGYKTPKRKNSTKNNPGTKRRNKNNGNSGNYHSKKNEGSRKSGTFKTGKSNNHSGKKRK